MENFLETVGACADILGVVGAVIAAFASVASWRAQRRAAKLASETVTVSLAIEGEGRTVTLPLEIVRRDLSRAELLGRIGMIPMRQAGARFSLRQLGSPAVMRAINAVTRGEASSLVILASREEVDQFDL